jgi:PAS domain S-box-containing protein
MDLIAQLERQLNSGINSRERIDILNALAWELRFDDVPRAFSLSQSAQELSTTGQFAQQPYQNGLAESLLNLGHCYERLNDYNQAISYLQQALALFAATANRSKQATLLYLLGGNYWSLGDYAQALKCSLGSVTLSQEVNDPYSEAKALNIIGLIYQSIGNFNEAIRYFAQAQQIYEEIGHHRGQGDTLSNCSEAYFDLGDFENALTYGLKSLQIHQEIGYVRDLGVVWTVVGRAYLALQQPQQAQEALWAGLAVSQKSGNTYGELRCLLYLGELHFRQEAMDQALSFLQQALPLAQEIGTRQELADCYHFLAKVHKQNVHFEEALTWYERFQQLKEILLTESAKHKLDLLKIAHDAELAKREAETQRVKNIALEHEVAERIRTEELLRKNEALLQAIINNTVASVNVLDLQGRFLLVNDYFVNQFGLDKDKVIGVSVNELFRPELADFFFRTNREVLNTKSALQFEEVVSLPRGERTFMTSKFPLFDGSGSIFAICGLSTDITERKQMEQALSASEDRIRRVLSTISDHIYVTEITRDGKRLNRFLSPIEGLTGFPLQKIMADWSFWPTTLIHPDDRDTATAQFERLSQGQNSEVEYRLVRADGQVIWVRDSGRVERNPLTQHILVYGVVSDITPRKQAEEALKQSNQRLQQVLGQLQNRVVELLTLNQIIQTVTTVTELPVALHTVIALVGQLFKASFATIALLSPDKSELAVVAEYAKSSQDQPKLDKEGIIGLRFLITDGSYNQEVIQKKRAVVVTNAQTAPLTVSVHKLLRERGTHCLMIVPLLARGNVLGTIGIDLDQPERNFSAGEVRLAETIAGQIAGAIENAQLFSQEQHQRRLAEQANQFKSQLLAKVSHELRTPLGSILGYTELLAEGSFGPIDPHQQEIMGEVIESTHYLTSLVNELLDQAQFESGNLKLNISNFAPKTMLAQTQARMKLLARQKGLGLTFELDPHLPEVITGDSIRLQQILINLVSNALKFSQTGGVQVRLGRADEAYWSLQVTDTGPGIPAEAQAYIFEPFRQLDDTITRPHQGAGLGLAIVKQLTALMGGRIELVSQVGQGSTFTILLPLIQANEAIR